MADKLSLEQVAKFPRPGTSGPRSFGFTPDSRQVTYLFSGDGSLTLQLWAYDIASGERRQLTGQELAAQSSGPVTRDEELRRERSRTREVGVTSYQYARSAQPPVLLVPLAGKLYVQRGDGPLTPLGRIEGAIDPQLSPDGSKVAYVINNELCVADTTSGEDKTLTTSGGDGISNGLAEFVAQEEMGRAHGFWWSDDSQHLAYVRADSRHIKRYPIVHQGKDEVDIEEHRYPFTGAANAIVELGIIPAEGGPTTWLDLGESKDIYLARVNWRPDGTLTAQVQSRDQQNLKLVAFDPKGGQFKTLLEETGTPWVNLSDDLTFLASGEMVWTSERTGYRHLYLYDTSGQARQLTDGDWMISGGVRVDETGREAYFTATKDGVTERHLYKVSLDGGEVVRLTSEAGWHDTIIAPDFSHFIDRYQSISTPPSVTLRRIDGTPATTLYQDETTTPAALGLTPPELTTFTARDGETLHAAIYTPDNIEPGRRYPLIVSVYGGPHAQRVVDTWDLTVDMRAQYLAQHGFVVLKVDNRGSANRGLAFEGALAGKMGSIEVDDQVDGVRWLSERNYVDGQRVGIYGWSYGGYMTLMSMVKAAEVFKVGVAGAPVTHWDGYDTHYTEHYMGLLPGHEDNYTASAVMPYVENLRGKLLLVHGMVDENVHFRHTARLIVALTSAQKDYDLMLYPEERHMPRDAKGLEYMERRIIGYFQTWL